MECIVLAGGLGTRLKGIIGEIPKCMAVVAGQPILYHLFQYLTAQKCSRVILSLGYKHELVSNWLIATDWEFDIQTVIETEALGTGGGIQLAMRAAKNNDVCVINGDTMFDVPLQEMMQFHLSKNAECTLALKKLEHFERYGVVHAGQDENIVSFEEKKYQESGTINGGIYIINRAKFLARSLPEKFSFEQNYLEHFVGQKQFFAYKSEAYFIDIGVPEDFAQAQIDFK